MTRHLTCLIAAALALIAAPALAEAHGRHGPGFCPPGLAKKDPACRPPGQAHKHGHGHDRDDDDDDEEGGHHGSGPPAPQNVGCDGPFRLQRDGTWVIDPKLCGPIDLTPAVGRGKDLMGGLSGQDRTILGLSLLAAMMK